MTDRRSSGPSPLVVALVLTGGLAAGVGCSLALDFDSELDLPCPCKPDYLCLRTSNVCVLKGSVDDYKSCSFDADVPDDLCQAGSTCIDFRGGPKCLPECFPQQYITGDASASIRAECSVGRTCWPIPGGGEAQGVCFEGECNELANDCTAPQRCVNVNAAGVCFTPCKIFSVDQPCLGGQACHPLGSTNVMACVRPGIRKDGEVCTEKDPCAATTDDGTARPLVCDRPSVAGAADVRRCRKICPAPSTTGCDGGEACLTARLDVDPDRRDVTLGLCIPQ